MDNKLEVVFKVSLQVSLIDNESVPEVVSQLHDELDSLVSYMEGVEWCEVEVL